MTEEARRYTIGILLDNPYATAVYDLLTEVIKLQCNKLHLLLYGTIATITIIGVVILLNQRKIRKELRQLREMMENQDKPNGETYESDTE